MKTKMLIPILSLILSALISCDANEPQVEMNTLKLSLIDVSVREAYLHIEAEKIRDNEDIVLFRNGKEVLSFKNTQKDTTITDTALTENTSYRYIVYSRSNNVETARSEEVSVTTLMPTSHEFSWQTYIFGYQTTSILYDIEIVNENDIWAVGEFFLKDSLTNKEDLDTYGAAHWNGIKWEFFKVPSKSYPTISPFPTIVRAITMIGNTLYASNGGNLMRYENGKWNEIAMFIQDEKFNGQVREIWGRDESNIYCAGLNGSIYHVTKQHIWNKLPYESQYAGMSIWGFTNPLTGKDEIYCPMYDTYNTYKSKLLKITDDNKISEVKWDENEVLSDVWTNNGFPVYAVGKRFFENSKSRWKEIPLENVVSLSFISGTKLNDIAAAGVGSIVHYNGKDWRVYNISNSVYLSVDLKKDIIAAAGWNGNNAVVTIGRRK